MCYFMIASESWYLKSESSYRCLSPGSESAVNCVNITAKGNPRHPNNIQWYKKMDDGGLRLIENRLAVFTDGYQLRFHNVVAENDGFYCCKTPSDNNCSGKATVQINIDHPPVILPLQNKTASIGDKITLTCAIRPATGCRVKFSWRWHERMKESNFSVNKSYNLTISNVTTEDEGYYDCQVESKGGQNDHRSLYLFVKPLNPPGTCTCYGQHTLDCTNKNCSLIQVRYIWYTYVTECVYSFAKI